MKMTAVDWQFRKELQLPLLSLTEEYKVTKVRQLLMFRDSRDAKVGGAKEDITSGRKWLPKRTMNGVVMFEAW